MEITSEQNGSNETLHVVYGQVVADGMAHLIPMWRASGHLNANAYEVSCSRTIYHEFSFFPRTIRE